MNEEEIFEFYQYYKRFYFAGDVKSFLNVFGEEFKGIPLDIMKQALQRWSRRPKGSNPPTVFELKDTLWRMKLVAMARLFESDQNEQWNQEYFGTRHYSPAELINETEDEKWAIYDEMKPVLSEDQKIKLTAAIAKIKAGLKGFNEQYE